MPQTKKKCCISSRHKVNTSYHNLPNDITLNAAWKTLEDRTERSTGLRDHIMRMQNMQVVKFYQDSKI
jgi:hypothetical protein